MHDADHQTTGGEVLWHFAMSLDGCVAGSEHAMDRITGFSHGPSLSDDGIAGTVDDMTISCPAEDAVANHERKESPC